VAVRGLDQSAAQLAALAVLALLISEVGPARQPAQAR
jgi:hypothetical protein